MTTRLTTLLLVIALCYASASAQRRLVVADVETLLPVIGASVVGGRSTVMTDSAGWFSVPDSCKSLIFSHVGYESRIVNVADVRDTVFLISKLLSVEGVVVFGRKKDDSKIKELNKRLRMQQTEMQLAAADPSKGTDLLKLFGYLIPKKWRKNKKEERKKRLKEILDAY